jgi:hypothetical protein
VQHVREVLVLERRQPVEGLGHLCVQGVYLRVVKITPEAIYPVPIL